MNHVHRQFKGNDATYSDLHRAVLEIGRNLKVVVGNTYILMSARRTNKTRMSPTSNRVDPRHDVVASLVLVVVLVVILPAEPQKTVRSASRNESEGAVSGLSLGVIGPASELQFPRIPLDAREGGNDRGSGVAVGEDGQ